MSSKQFPLVAALIALTAIGLSGCDAKPATDIGHHDGDGHDHQHDHDHLAASEVDVPKDFDEAIARIKACHASVKVALEQGELHDAHDPVDEAAIVLEKMMPLAKESGIDRSHWKEINLLVQELGVQFDAVHEAVEQHAEGEVAIPEVDETIRRLEVLAQTSHATQQ